MIWAKVSSAILVDSTLNPAWKVDCGIPIRYIGVCLLGIPQSTFRLHAGGLRIRMEVIGNHFQVNYR
jgi:hypothetical protein